KDAQPYKKEIVLPYIFSSQETGPPESGNRVPSSAILNIPKSTIRPAEIQATITKVGEYKPSAIGATFLKTPEPIMELITIIMAIFNPNDRNRPVCEMSFIYYCAINTGIFTRCLNLFTVSPYMK